MSCHGCASGFGFLKKEYSCPNCGYSFCKNCLRFKGLDSKSGKETLVCQRCSTGMKNMEIDPPVITKALQKLESMDNPARPPIVLYNSKDYATQEKFARLKRGMSEEDKHLADRLELLMKSDRSGGNRRKSGETIEEEIATRLAKLKDEDPSLIKLGKSSSAPFQVKPAETDQELITKLTAEAKLDSQYQAGFNSAVSDIEARLGKLRGSSDSAASSGQVPSSSNRVGMEEDEELTEEEQVARIIAKFKEEVELEASTGSTSQQQPVDAAISSDEDNEDVDNLCRICEDKRATLKCEECDDDLFCAKCFKELHNEIGEMHKPTPLKK